MSVTIERRAHVADITIDRADAGNKLDGATLESLRRCLVELAGAGGPSVVVIQAGGDDFSLGRERVPGVATPDGLAREFGLIQEVNELIQRAPFVTIAAVQGRAHGAGLSLAARCDLVIATESAQLSFPEVPHGVPPTIVLSHYQHVLPRKTLLDMILTGRELSAAEGVAAGLVTRVVQDHELRSVVRVEALLISGYDSRTLRTVKKYLVASEGMDPRDTPTLGIAMYINEMVGRSLGTGGD